MTFRTKDSPDANGRVPVTGDIKWTLMFPLDTGEKLYVSMGQGGRDAILSMLAEETNDLNSHERKTRTT